MINRTDKIDEYINFKNKYLWNQIREKYNIRLILDSSEYSWLMIRTANGYDIVCPNTEISYSSFTHELLHIHLEDLGMIDYDSFYNSYKYDNLFDPLFTNLFGYIFNFSCHKKMFPFYKQMGFSEYDFVQQRIDYNWKRHLKIKILFKIRKMKLLAVDQFLGNFFALKNNVVTADNEKCKKYLNKLKNLNPELYGIAERFDDKWDTAENYNFLETFNQFKADLRNWLVKTYGR